MVAFKFNIRSESSRLAICFASMYADSAFMRFNEKGKFIAIFI